jgi:hypothetical protein
LRRKRGKEYVRNSFANGMIVTEWVSDDQQVESTEGDQEIPPAGEAVKSATATAMAPEPTLRYHAYWKR